MKATFVLTPAEARRLIAKATIQTPEFQKAWKDAYVILAGGTTNAFIAQELGYDVEPGLCTVGTSTSGLLCVTEPSSRKSFPNVFYKGQPVDKKIDEALQDFHADTVIIKGANAFDLDGHVGVITSGFNGGTIPNFIGYMTSKGLKWICPVGYEKMVPSVPAASKALGGAMHIDISMGADPGQLIKALREAEEFDGPSVIVAYTPCISHGIRNGMSRVQEEMKRAVQSGYWNLYRYDPRREAPLRMDSKAPTMDYQEFLDGENRYASLKKSFPENAQELFRKGREDAAGRYEKYKRMEEQQNANG